MHTYVHTCIHTYHIRGSVFFSSCVLPSWKANHAAHDIRRSERERKEKKIHRYRYIHFTLQLCTHVTHEKSGSVFPLIDTTRERDDALRAMGKIAYFLIYSEVCLPARLRARDTGREEKKNKRRKILKVKRVLRFDSTRRKELRLSIFTLS